MPNDSSFPRELRGPATIKKVGSPADALTPSQREFARVLGRLLADIWERERFSRSDTLKRGRSS